MSADRVGRVPDGGVRLTSPRVPGLVSGSDLGPLGQCQGILDLDTEVENGRLDLGVSEQDLHGSQVAGLLVDKWRPWCASANAP
jgi:hypothetical protein